MTDRSEPDCASLLPPSIAALAAVIGWPAALVLVETFPGQTLVIGPRASATMDAVRAAVGVDVMKLLADTNGGSPLYIPACARLARAERNRRIRNAVRDLERTVSTRRAVTLQAREWRLTERTIWRVLSPDNNVATSMPPQIALHQLPLI